MARHRQIPKKALNEVLLKSKRRCCICYDQGSQKPVEGNLVNLVVAEDATADSVSNLAYLCLNHHARFRSGDISPDEVRHSRDRLYDALKRPDSKREEPKLRYQEYEKRVVEILRQEMSRTFGDFFGFEVTPRLASRSGLEREVDVAIILRPLGFTLHVLVEIKYSSRGLVVSDIEAIGAKFEDLGAAKGVIVCNSGFTRDAITRAKSMGIGLLHIQADPEESGTSASDEIIVVD